MDKKQKYTGFAIALAWPATYCKQPGAWYDPLTSFLGFNENNYYKVGHAAVVLVDSKNRKCHYFDFGRYHAPFQFGRVRSAETDHDLHMITTPAVSSDGKNLENLDAILTELQNNGACHGEGILYASVARVKFEKAYGKAIQMQEKKFIDYGPFRTGGSNCSRFVNAVIRAGEPSLKQQLKLNFWMPLTPTPLNNVNALGGVVTVPKLLQNEPFCPLKKPDKAFLRGTLPTPERHAVIPETALWLSGEGAGSWFDIRFERGELKVIRYSPEGKEECSGIYRNISGEYQFPQTTFKITYPSNCKEITLLLGNQQVCFERIPEVAAERKIRVA
ncbi:MAG: hypothetical protein K0B11_12550 [Mariniphaga sp.]|nr:hypothetical protein [Mariniphaga sp.]